MAAGLPGTAAWAVAQARWRPSEVAAHGPVDLDVTDGERSLTFWQRLVGLELISRSDERIEVGAGDRTLLVLHPGAGAPAPKGHTGLYHVAVHLPDEAEFAYALARLFAARYPNSPTEHLFSKATYLDDPDGIGVELTLETPGRVKQVKLTSGWPELIDADGVSHPPVGHLDLEETMSHLRGDETGRPLDPRTWIGHIHVHVDDLEAARNFYSFLLGFPVGLDTPEISMLDVHFEGAFRHRIAVNGWNGPNAVQAPAGSAGLRHFTLVYDTNEQLASALERLGEADVETRATPEGFLVNDPAGNRMHLVAGD